MAALLLVVVAFANLLYHFEQSLVLPSDLWVITRSASGVWWVWHKYSGKEE
jgi:hypothetical protein